LTPALHFTHFGKYEIIRKLGRSMTDVYLALDPDENRRVVLKIVEQCRDSYTQVIVDAERRGAAIQQQLHSLDPRILEIYDFGEQNGCFYVVMQYVEGRSLADLLRHDSKLEPMVAARYAAEICSQLASLHAFQIDVDSQKRAVVHGDVKPSNIQIAPNGDVWLLDFGIAKAITATRNLTQHNLGSPAYCSPERLKNAQVDPQADLWATGVCLYEMVAGMPPYQAQTTRKLENLIQSRRPPRALPGNTPHALKAIIWKALAAEASRRYASAAALEQDLRAFLGNTRTIAETEHTPSWDSNATLEKAKSAVTAVGPAARARFARFIAECNVLMWSLVAGLVVGMLCFVPASHAYRYWHDSASLRAKHSYLRAKLAAIESEWSTYRALSRDYAWLGSFSPVLRLSESLKSRLVAAADDVIVRYRNSSDPAFQNYDWVKARASLAHALELDLGSVEITGKMALCDGYLQLGASPPATSGALASFEAAAADLPSSPDPHLGLARIYIYSQQNAGKAAAEFRTAERLGYSLGPREFEQQADGYLLRAEQSLRRFQKAGTVSDRRKYKAPFDRDLDRARNLYEPIAGYSDVDDHLDRLEQDAASVDEIEQQRERARLVAAKRKGRDARRQTKVARFSRWR
jgi:serine/threonine protein kinase